jgi:predicted HTH transcriptional regulator
MEENRLRADETEIAEVSGTSIHDIDKSLFSDFFKKEFRASYRAKGLTFEEAAARTSVMRNGSLTLAGLLFFSRSPHAARQAFTVRTAAYKGGDIRSGCLGESEQRGTVPEMYHQTMQYFTYTPAIAIEPAREILGNALVHRDYGKNSPVRVLIFDNRIEIISPGALHGGLSVEGIQDRAPVTRNPLVAYFAKRALPYSGLGAGLRRAFKCRPDIGLYNDIEGGQFVATIPRPSIEEYEAEYYTEDFAETRYLARLRDSYDEFIRAARQMRQKNLAREPEEVEA